MQSYTKKSIRLLTLAIIFGAIGGVLGTFITINISQNPVYERLVTTPLTEISSYTILQKMNRNDSNFIIVDTRNKASYDLGHIKGAISLPFEEISIRYKELPENKEIVVYCWTQECMLGPVSAALLTKLGVENVKEFRIGWCEWAERGYPIEGKRYILAKECLQPQRSINNETIEIIEKI